VPRKYVTLKAICNRKAQIVVVFVVQVQIVVVFVVQVEVVVDSMIV